MRIVYKVTSILLIMTVLSSCKTVDINQLRIFYPKILPENNFKRIGINRALEVDMDQYVFSNGDTTFTYEYQQGNLEAIYWAFPCTSYNELLKVLEVNNQMIICSDVENKRKVIVQNMITKHIFWCSINPSDESVSITYDVIR